MFLNSSSAANCFLVVLPPLANLHLTFAGRTCAQPEVWIVNADGHSFHISSLPWP